MNYITITGNLGRDAETKYLPDGTTVLSFSVADSQGKDKPAIWWNCSLFGKRADVLSQYLTRGQQVTVVGQVSEREYTAADGAIKKALSVRVQDVALQGGRRDDGAGHTQPQAQARPQAAARPAAPPVRAPATAGGFADMDDDIPF